MDINVNYLGNPRITVNGKKVVSLQNKNFALLLYIHNYPIMILSTNSLFEV